MTPIPGRRLPYLAAMALLCATRAHAANIELFPGQSFEAAVESLNPGDTLIVHAGTYSDSGRISIGVRGTSAAPVVIKGADGEALPLVTRVASAPIQNTINIEGATHLRITRLEISGNGGDGINLSGAPSFITLDNLEIHDIDVGVNFRSSMSDITVRHNHIHHTGQNGGTGEGMYVGCNDATCVVSRALIENNWIHDTQNSTQGDGIEVKHGSHSNIVRDNVIYNTGYPCVLVYGTVGQPVNVIEGNVLWNCGDSGIQAAADAIIRNNIILGGPGNGFNSQPHQGATPSNLQFVHNTVVGGSPCLRLSSWSGRPGLVFANNAIYCDADDFAIGGLTGVTVAGNVVTPATSASVRPWRLICSTSPRAMSIRAQARAWSTRAMPLTRPASISTATRAAAHPMQARTNILRHRIRAGSWRRASRMRCHSRLFRVSRSPATR